MSSDPYHPEGEQYMVGACGYALRHPSSNPSSATNLTETILFSSSLTYPTGLLWGFSEEERNLYAALNSLDKGRAKYILDTSYWLINPELGSNLQLKFQLINWTN